MASNLLYLNLPSLPKKALVLQKCSFKQKNATNTQKSHVDPSHIQPMLGWFATFLFALVLWQFARVLRHFARILQVSTFGPRRLQCSTFRKNARFIKTHSKVLVSSKNATKLQKVLVSLVRQKKLLRLKVQVFIMATAGLFWDLRTGSLQERLSVSWQVTCDVFALFLRHY